MLGGFIIGALLLAVLTISRISFGTLDNGFSAILDKANNGVNNAQATKTMVAQANKSISTLSNRMLTIADDISHTNQNIKILARKVTSISVTLDELTESMEAAVDELPEGEARYSLEDAADSVGDIKESMRREALISLSSTMEKMALFSESITTQVEGVTALAEKLTKMEELSTEAVSGNQDISTLSETFGEDIHNSNLIITLFLLAVIVISFISNTLLTFQITQPLRKITNIAKDIAEGEGDLTRRLDESRKDELGELAHWFNTFVGKLQTLINEVQSSSSSCQDAAQILSATNQKSSEGIQHQQMQTEQIATALTQLTNMVQNVAQDTAKIGHATMEANNHANIGAQVVDQTTASINTLAQEVEQSADVIQQLNKQSSKIGAVLSVIKGIAEQTNLLALNAAIEAARAGEQGRGFAVVADEVRTLASRTQQATQEIQEMIEQVQSGTTQAVKAMENGRNRARESVEKAESARTALGEITTSVTGINTLAIQIAEATEQESTVSAQISQSMEVINSVAHENGQFSQEAAANSEQLSVMARQLQELVGRFKV